MRGMDDGAGESRGQTPGDKAAFAIEAGTDSDAVAGALLRIRSRGHDAFLLADEDRHSEAVVFAHELDVPVVFPAERAVERREELRSVVRGHGYPGVIYHDDPREPLDVESSITSLEESDSYLVEARTSPRPSEEPAVLVAIPAYNESGTVGDVVAGALAHADEVLVVDDGSGDDTATVARGAGATVIEHRRNRGYGAALKTAFREADRSGAGHLVVLDADGQHDPADVSRLVGEQRETGAEIVIGCRFGEDADTVIPPFRRFGLGIVNILTNLSLGVLRPSARVRDTQSGFRCYNEVAIKSLAADESIGNHMGASTDILHHAHARGYDIEEVATTVNYDVENGSSGNPLSHGATLVGNLLRTVERKRPLLMLGVPGFALALLGLWFGYLTFSNYISTNTFPVGHGLVGAFLSLAGVFTVFTAIILHALRQHLKSVEG